MVRSDRTPFRTRIYNFASDASIIGLSVIFSADTHPFRRLCWGLLVLVGAGFMTYIIVDRVTFFLENPTSVRFELVFPSQLEFPVVTICNDNMLRKSWLIDNDLYDNVTSFVREANHHLSESLFDENYETPHLIDPLSEEMTQQAAHRKEDLVKFVFLSDGPYNLSNFKLVQTDAGVCYTFNSEPDQRIYASGSGVVSGLTMFLDTQQDEYLLEDVARFSSAGFMLQLHSLGDVPIMFSKHVKIAPGMVTDIAMKMSKLKFLPPPAGTCGSKALKYHRLGYGTSACQHECRSDHVIAACGCRLPNLVGTAAACSDLHDRVCALVASLRFQASPMLQDACGCPNECQSTVYEASVSSAPFSQTYVQFVRDSYDWESLGIYNVTSEFIRDNFALLYIYFASKSYETYEQQPAYSGWAMMSDIGGALGLFLGAAVLTFAEILDFFLLTIFDYLYYRWEEVKYSRNFHQPRVIATKWLEHPNSTSVDESGATSLVSPSPPLPNGAIDNPGNTFRRPMPKGALNKPQMRPAQKRPDEGGRGGRTGNQPDKLHKRQGKGKPQRPLQYREAEQWKTMTPSPSGARKREEMEYMTVV